MSSEFRGIDNPQSLLNVIVIILYHVQFLHGTSIFNRIRVKHRRMDRNLNSWGWTHKLIMLIVQNLDTSSIDPLSPRQFVWTLIFFSIDPLSPRQFVWTLVFFSASLWSWAISITIIDKIRIQPYIISLALEIACSTKRNLKSYK
jgi:hypothetical protein